MSERDEEVLVPLRVLGIGDHAGPGDSGLRDDNGDVRIASDDLAMVLGLPVGFGGVVFVVGGGGGETTRVRSAGSEAAAKALGSQVHVGKAASGENGQIEVAVQVDHLLR